MPRRRLDVELARRQLVTTRSQAESWIKMGRVNVDGKAVTKPGTMVDSTNVILLDAESQYVSRAGLKLASVARALKLDFRGKVVLDVGSSTGGFTDYALQNDAKKVIAVDVGTDQLHPSLRGDERIELHEKTDIRDFSLAEDARPDIILVDVSFISLRDILPAVARFCKPETMIAAMVKPQFEAGAKEVSRGVIKNDTVRRNILKDFEAYARAQFTIVDKADSDVAGAKGNRERFYKLRLVI